LAPAKPASPRKSPPTTGAALIEQARVKNRLMAIGMAGFFITAFILVMVVTVVNKRYDAAHHHAAVMRAAVPAHAAAVR
jgi:hypothetical protein